MAGKASTDESPEMREGVPIFHTPVALVIFRRPDLTRQVLTVLRAAEIRRLFVVADGPRFNNPTEEILVRQTRELIDEIDWDCEVTRIYSEENLGLRKRVLTGLDQVFQQVDSAIVLEDDCVPHQSWFGFASTLLEHYRHSSEVGIVSANNFSPNHRLGASYYFSSHPYIWGWATWKRTWLEFRAAQSPFPLSEEQSNFISARLPGVWRSKSFLRLAKNAESYDSWAIQFAAWSLLNEKLTIVPKVNLARNIGFGKDSTHTRFESYVHDVQAEPVRLPLIHPELISPDYLQMRSESNNLFMQLLLFPLFHPLNFLGRFRRWVMHLRPQR